MQFRMLMSMAATALTCLALLGCTSTSTTSLTDASAATAWSPATLAATYANLAQSGGKVFRLDPLTSRVRIYVFRAGAAARLGHNHVLAAPRFIGFFHLPLSAATDGRFDLAFRLDELAIDDPHERAGLGSAFASQPSPQMIAGTREHMLGADNFQADRYPWVSIHSLQISGEAPRFAAKVSIQMHGQARELWVPLSVEGLPEQLSVSGSLVLRQSDFGVRPYSVMGGLLAVQDEVVIDFRLRAQ